MKLREKDTANDSNEFHLAAIEDEKVVGCVLLRPLNQSAIQLRQMAILDSYRGKNIGAQLVTFAEHYAIQKGFSVIETRARKTALGFYSRLGYQSFENEFCDEHTLLMRKPISAARTAPQTASQYV
jgi:N-acetylglutamate synthase-like GNAT family acetyltransferase